MRKRISESIQAKTFLSMLALLVVCCIIIYGMVMIFLPRNYHTELEGQVTSDFYDLVDILERNGWEASSDSLLEFSMTNNASVEISDDIGNSLFSVNYADMEKMDSSAPSMSLSLIHIWCGTVVQDADHAGVGFRADGTAKPLAEFYLHIGYHHSSNVVLQGGVPVSYTHLLMNITFFLEGNTISG